MATIRMIKTAAGSFGTFNASTVYPNVDPDLAGLLAEAGACVIVAEGPKVALAAEPATREVSPDWPLKTPPAEYLERYGHEAKYSALAREIVG